MATDRHKTQPLRFRPPAAERLWLENYQQRSGKPMNAILTDAVRRLRAEVEQGDEGASAAGAGV